MKQRFASFSGIVHKLEETEVQGEFLLGNAPMGAQPAPQERPKPFHGIHMDFTQAVAIFISGVLTSSMVDTLMIVAPSTQTCINTVFICINKRTQSSVLLYGNERLPTISLTLALPDGRSVDLGQAPVTDQQGVAGLTGRVNQHYWRLFGAVFIGGALRHLRQAKTCRLRKPLIDLS